MPSYAAHLDEVITILQKDLERIVEERDMLRAALEKIITLNDVAIDMEGREIARAALKGKYNA